MIDPIDRKIIEALQQDGRITNVELAARIHLSAPQALRRVRSLEERGVITGWRAIVDPESVGLGVMAFVSLNIDSNSFHRSRKIEATIRAYPQILECHGVSGDTDYLLKVVARDLKSLSQFLTDQLAQTPGVGKVRSMICMEQIKPASPLPVSTE